MNNIKTLLITLDFPPLTGGVAEYYLNRVRKMKPEEIVVLADKKLEIGNWKLEIGSKIFYKKFLTPWIYPHWLPLIKHIYYITKKEKIKLLWVGQVLPVGTVVWMLKEFLNGLGPDFRRDDKNIKYFVTCHGNDLLRAKSHPRKFKLAKKILQNAEYIEANTKFTQQILINDFAVLVEKIKIVYPECTLSKEMVDQQKVESLKKKYSLENKKVLLTVARLVKSKGVEKIIKLMPKLVKEIPDLVYIIIGDGLEKENLEKILNKNIIFTGDVPHMELPNYYSLSDCFILVPENKIGIDKESFGVVYLEALEFGLPVIAGDVGGAKEIANKNIHLVDSNNLEEIKENVLKILK